MPVVVSMVWSLVVTISFGLAALELIEKPPVELVVKFGSPASNRPLPFSSRKTKALTKGPLITVPEKVPPLGPPPEPPPVLEPSSSSSLGSRPNSPTLNASKLAPASRLKPPLSSNDATASASSLPGSERARRSAGRSLRTARVGTRRPTKAGRLELTSTMLPSWLRTGSTSVSSCVRSRPPHRQPCHGVLDQLVDHQQQAAIEQHVLV